MTTLPPAIVLGVDSPIGLTVVRELGEHGVAVHGIATAKRGLGLHSRRLTRGYIREPDLVAQLNRIARDTGAPFLLTVSSGDALAMRAAADAGALPGLRPLLPPLRQLELVGDKAATCRIAASLGIAVPATWEPATGSPPAAFPRDLDYPCVLKWRDPERVSVRLAALGLPLLKTEYAYDAADLHAALGRYDALAEYPMVQSYARGTGLGQMFLMKDGRAPIRFQHRRVREWPPEGGTSTVCESLGNDDHRELMAKSEALLRAIGWEGPAMVEYRHDSATGRSVLMEVNGRFWGSLPLAHHAGARFALGAYYALGLGRSPPVAAEPRARLRCRYMIPETKRLLVVTLRPHAVADRALAFSRPREIASYLAGFLRPRGHYFIWKWSDPVPFIADTRVVLRMIGTALLALMILDL